VTWIIPQDFIYIFFVISQTFVKSSRLFAGPALADAGPNARLGRGALLSSDVMTPWCSVNRVAIVVERRYTVQH